MKIFVKVNSLDNKKLQEKKDKQSQINEKLFKSFYKTTLLQKIFYILTTFIILNIKEGVEKYRD